MKSSVGLIGPAPVGRGRSIVTATITDRASVTVAQNRTCYDNVTLVQVDDPGYRAHRRRMKALKERFRALGPKQDASLGTITGERVEPLVRKIVARTNPLDPRRIVRTVKSGRVQYFELDAVSVCGDQVVLFEVKTTSSPSSVATGKKQLLRARGILLGTGIFKSVKLRLVIVDIAGVAQEGWPEVEIDALSEPTGCIRVPAADVERVAASSGISLPEGWASASARIFSEIFPTASAPERGEQVSTTVALALRRAGLSLPGGV